MQEKLLKDAQYRKGLSIAFFNATNAAIEMVKVEGSKKVISIKKKGKVVKWEVPIEERIEYWRKYFIQKHQEYYTEVIANVGVNYKAEDAIKKLKEVTDWEGFKKVWRTFSEDERRDPEIRKVAVEVKNKYEKPQ